MTIAAVQEPSGVIGQAVTNVAISFASNVTTGNLIVAGCTRYDAGANTAFVAGDCTLSAGTATVGTITLDAAANVASTNPVQAGVWSMPVTATGSCTIRVGGASGAYFTFAIGEYSAIDVSGTRVDGTPSSNTATTATSPATSGNTTSTAGALFFAVVAIDTDGANTASSVGNSFTLLERAVDGTAESPGEIDRRIVTTATTTQGTWTWTTTSGHGWAAAVVAYKAASAGGGTANTLSLGGTLTPAGAVVKRTTAAKGGSITSTGAVAKLVRASKAGTITPAGTNAKAVAASKGGSLTPVGVIAKKTSKSEAGAITPSGALAMLRVKLLTLVGTITASGVIRRATAKALGGTLTPTGVVRKFIARTFAGLLDLAGAIATVFTGGGPGAREDGVFGPMIDPAVAVSATAIEPMVILSDPTRRVSVTDPTQTPLL